MTSRSKLLLESLAYFLGGALAILVVVRVGIPVLSRAVGISAAIAWFLASGVLVAFFFFGAIIAARRATGARSVSDTLHALQLRRVNAVDLVWTVGGLLAVVVLTAAMVTATSALFSIDLLTKQSYSSFLQLGPLKPHEYWIFLVWLPYFFFNIAGEELLWRGYLLPRQERALGSHAWIVNGLLWAVFHLVGHRLADRLNPAPD